MSNQVFLFIANISRCLLDYSKMKFMRNRPTHTILSIDLTLERHRLELRGSACRWNFSVVNAQHYSIHGWLTPQMLSEACGGLTTSYPRTFGWVEGQRPSTCIVQGSAV